MTQDKPSISAIDRIALVVADRDEAEHFFREAFAFDTVERRPPDEALARLLGLPGARAGETLMRLGAQTIALLAFDPPGRPYPNGSNATDLLFQHFAIIVSDMPAAYRHLQSVGRFTPISEDGPRLLPPRSGSVSAFKFRDSEGHPLELLGFPEGQGPAHWRDKAGKGLFLGIDHSAISVADTAASIAFYQTCLGLALGEQTENTGAEQARMDAVPDAAVTVTGLDPVNTPPHVELLGYHVGTRRPIADDTRGNDVAASLFVLRTESLATIVEALTAAKARFISPGIVTLATKEQAIAVLDPDGHRLVVIQGTDP